uniref:Secreted protein n=1 Tax=Knipowitschia caucasica TaxID=637954 RepID=A0AAV2K3B8_KNICA
MWRAFVCVPIVISIMLERRAEQCVGGAWLTSPGAESLHLCFITNQYQYECLDFSAPRCQIIPSCSISPEPEFQSARSLPATTACLHCLPPLPASTACLQYR